MFLLVFLFSRVASSLFLCAPTLSLSPSPKHLTVLVSFFLQQLSFDSSGSPGRKRTRLMSGEWLHSEHKKKLWNHPRVLSAVAIGPAANEQRQGLSKHVFSGVNGVFHHWHAYSCCPLACPSHHPPILKVRALHARLCCVDRSVRQRTLGTLSIVTLK